MYRVLVIAFRALGDMVLITPIVRLLKRARPSVHLTVVVDALSHEVLLHNPHIDRLVVVDRIAERRLPAARRWKEEYRRLADLRAGRFDVAVDVFGGPRSALMTWWSGAPARYGAAEPRLRSRVYTHCARVEPEGEHLVRQKLKIAAPLIEPFEDDLALELVVTPEEAAWGLECLRRHGVEDHDLAMGLFPGAGWAYRRWPSDKFAALGDRLAAHPRARVLLIGGEQDRDACAEVAARMAHPSTVLIQRSVRQTMAILNRLDLFVSNDTGPMHIATALGRPTVALFGPGNVVKYGPWGGRARVLTMGLPCSPCPQWFDPCPAAGRERQECLTRLAVDDVYAAALDLVGLGLRPEAASIGSSVRAADA